MNLLQTTGLIAIAATLSACGGSGVPTYSEMISDGNRIANEIRTIPYTDPTTLPRSGGANYNGYLGVTTSDRVSALGEMDMNVSFGPTDRISGSVSNISSNNNVTYDGTLAIGNSTLDRGANTSISFTYSADLTGTIRGDDGTTVVVDAGLAGDFTGTNHGYVEGIVNGNVTIDGRGLSITEGAFVGER